MGVLGLGVVGVTMGAMEMEGVGGAEGQVAVMVVVEEGEVVDLGGGGEEEVVSGAGGNEVWNGMLAWGLLGIINGVYVL